MKPRIAGKLKNKISSTARLMKNLIYPDAIILMYHRVAEFDSDPWALNVLPKNFAEQLEVLRRNGRPLKLEQLRKKLNANQTVKRSFVITFDDGYSDNFYKAKPLLDKYDLPATIFVATCNIDQEKEFWWDELERLFLQPGNLPNVLLLDIKGRTYQWELGDAKNYSEAEHLTFRQWQFLKEPAENPTRRHEIYRSIYELMQTLTAYERDKVLQDLRVCANIGTTARTTHRSLSYEEIIVLDESGLIEIGAHTVTHSFLSQLPENMQFDEIKKSKVYLEHVLGHPVTSFAYPHGSYTNETISLVQETGFRCACSCNRGRINRRSNLFALPRFEVGNLDGDNFARWISSL